MSGIEVNKEMQAENLIPPFEVILVERTGRKLTILHRKLI